MKILRNFLSILFLCLAVSCVPDDKVIEVKPSNCENAEYMPAICIKYKEKYYYVEELPRTNWLEAQHICRQNNGNLVTVESEAEMKALSDYFMAQKYNEREDFAFWTAGNSAANVLHYMSIGNGQNLYYEKWANGEPKKDKHCITLEAANGEFAMHTADCNEQYQWVCELNTTSNAERLRNYKSELEHKKNLERLG